jgi:hypothetical protein
MVILIVNYLNFSVVNCFNLEASTCAQMLNNLLKVRYPKCSRVV